MEIHQKPLIVSTTALGSCPSSKLYPGTTCFGSMKAGRFVQPPTLRKPGIPVETKKTRNAIWSRVHRISARDHFSGPVSWQKRFFVHQIIKLQNPKCCLIYTVNRTNPRRAHSASESVCLWTSAATTEERAACSRLKGQPGNPWGASSKISCP